MTVTPLSVSLATFRPWAPKNMGGVPEMGYPKGEIWMVENNGTIYKKWMIYINS
jgi:hypothetical protein